MKQADLAIICTEMMDSVATIVGTAQHALTSKFQAKENTNEFMADEATKNQVVARLVLAQALAPVCKSWLDSAKMEVDVTCGDENVDNVLTYSKRQNKDTTVVKAVDLVTELAKLGVEKAVVDKAYVNASSTRKGNTYYEVRVNEG
jgi:hypothetical protein